MFPVPCKEDRDPITPLSSTNFLADSCQQFAGTMNVHKANSCPLMARVVVSDKNRLIITDRSRQTSSATLASFPFQPWGRITSTTFSGDLTCDPPMRCQRLEYGISRFWLFRSFWVQASIKLIRPTCAIYQTSPIKTLPVSRSTVSKSWRNAYWKFFVF